MKPKTEGYYWGFVNDEGYQFSEVLKIIADWNHTEEDHPDFWGVTVLGEDRTRYLRDVTIICFLFDDDGPELIPKLSQVVGTSA